MTSVPSFTAEQRRADEPGMEIGMNGSLQAQAPSVPTELVERLEAVRHTREDWHEPYGAIDLPCDAEDYGATAHLINPDGPAAVALITAMREAIQEALGHLASDHNAHEPLWSALYGDRL